MQPQLHRLAFVDCEFRYLAAPEFLRKPLCHRVATECSRASETLLCNRKKFRSGRGTASGAALKMRRHRQHLSREQRARPAEHPCWKPSPRKLAQRLARGDRGHVALRPQTTTPRGESLFTVAYRSVAQNGAKPRMAFLTPSSKSTKVLAGQSSARNCSLVTSWPGARRSAASTCKGRL
jgi:hypothetical protein